VCVKSSFIPLSLLKFTYTPTPIPLRNHKSRLAFCGIFLVVDSDWQQTYAAENRPRDAPNAILAFPSRVVTSAKLLRYGHLHGISPRSVGGVLACIVGSSRDALYLHAEGERQGHVGWPRPGTWRVGRQRARRR